jgi:hypothetical protein
MNARTAFEEVLFDLYDASHFGRLPPDYRSWKEFAVSLAEKLERIEPVLFPEGETK